MFPGGLSIAITLSLAGQDLPRTPRPGSADRSAIMTAIREGTGATTRFDVRFLRVSKGERIDIAYVEVAPVDAQARPFEGWVQLSRRPGREWRVDRGIGANGSRPCEELAPVYAAARLDAERAGVGRRLFSPAFLAEQAETASSEAGLGCPGEPIVIASDPSVSAQ